jgi:hypothetical protein
MNSMPERDDALPETPRAMPPVATSPTTNVAPSASAGLGAAMREEVWTIVRAAVDEAVQPLVARQRELEARLERTEREAREAREAASRPRAGGTSIPIAASSLAPPAFVAPAPPPLPRADVSPGSVTTPGARMPSVPDAPQARAMVAAPVALPGPRGSIPPQGLGVAVMPGPSPTLVLDNVGPVDVEGFDGGRRQKTVARVVVFVLLAIIVSVVVMTLVSRS